MRQQINLYQPIFTEARKPFSAGVVALAMSLVIVALTTYSVHARMGLGRLEAEVESLRVEAAEQQALVTKNDEELAARDKPVAIERRVKSLEQAILDRRSALKVLQDGGAGQTSGFAARMEALARRHVEGLWLDQLMMSGTNGSMTLAGATFDADTVPVYLKSLAGEPVLSGTRFDEFFIERPAPGRPESAPESDDGSEPKTAKGAGHIRFRAGSKTLGTTETAS